MQMIPLLHNSDLCKCFCGTYSNMLILLNLYLCVSKDISGRSSSAGSGSGGDGPSVEGHRERGEEVLSSVCVYTTL